MGGRLPVVGSGAPVAVITRHAGGSKNSCFDGTDGPPPMTMRTVRLLVSITSAAVAPGTGVRVVFASVRG